MQPDTITKEGNANTGLNASVQCVEVLISRSYIDNANHNLPWMLSVYSLENHPVQNRSLYNSDLFRFMVFDWDRTVRNLLESHKISFSIVKYFSSKDVFAAADTSGDDVALLAALESLSAIDASTSHSELQTDKSESDLILGIS